MSINNGHDLCLKKDCKTLLVCRASAGHMYTPNPLQTSFCKVILQTFKERFNSYFGPNSHYLSDLRESKSPNKKHLYPRVSHRLFLPLNSKLQAKEASDFGGNKLNLPPNTTKINTSQNRSPTTSTRILQP